MLPETRYTSVGEDQVAYQIFGEGPDLLFPVRLLNHVDFRWHEPASARFLRRLASFSRVITFDRRGTGASDPLPAPRATAWEDWVDDMNAVLDAVGSDRPAILAQADAGPAAMVYAAMHPERVPSLVLANTAARAVQAPDHPFGLPPEFQEPFLQIIEAGWGREDTGLAAIIAPDHADDQDFIRWYAALQRASMTPKRAAAMWRLLLGIDVRHVLPLIQAPTLVVSFSGSQMNPPANGRYLAEQIPNARFAEVQGRNTVSWLNDTDAYLSAVEEHVTGRRADVEPDRVLATVLFTDIVGSTERAAALGDRRWRQLLDVHEQLSGLEVERFGGRMIKSTGDGILATFDGPARAIRAALRINEALDRQGIRIRSGLHAGEVELRGADIGGIAVHIAARVMGMAAPGETVVSATVKGLVAGSGLAFEDRGVHTLKGVPDAWQLHAVVG